MVSMPPKRNSKGQFVKKGRKKKAKKTGAPKRKYGPRSKSYLGYGLEGSGLMGSAYVGAAYRKHRGRSNPWIAHVTRWARAHHVPYGVAMQNPACRRAYYV